VVASAYQVLEDCPDCKVSSAMVALYDPAVVAGVSVEAACRLCGRTTAQGALQRRGRRFEGLLEVIDALDRWAEADGEPDVERYCAANFNGESATAVAKKVLAGEVVETGFDVFSFLFPGMGGGGGAGASEGEELRPRTAKVANSVPLTPATVPQRVEGPVVEPPDPARTPARALAAIMLADGVMKEKEHRFLEAWLARYGHPPLIQEDLRAWRPGDLAPPAQVEPLVHAMIELAHVDRERDGTEWRVVREFARRWGYPMAELEARGRTVDELVAPVSTQLWRMIRAIFVSESR
jgi:hypothetical protein